MVSSNASLSPAEIAAARLSPAQPLFFQLYKPRDPARAAARVREVAALGYRAIFLTVDAPVSANRERDIRAPAVLEAQERAAAGPDALRDPSDAEADAPDHFGTAGALLANDDLDMTWKEVRGGVRRGRCACADGGADDPVAAERHDAADRAEGHTVRRGMCSLRYLWTCAEGAR